MYKVGLVGYGAFGKFIEEQLAGLCSFTIYDPATRPDGLEDALAQPIIILAIPAQNLEKFLAENHDSLNPSALYVDVCSVKVEPVRVMSKVLPESASIIATHPLFGPESAAKGLAGQKIMVQNVRASREKFQKFKVFLEKLELKIIETTPEKHDQDMAYVQGLSHYIGRIMQEMDIPESALTTRAYRDLLDMKNIQGNDSDELFYSILNLNPSTPKVIDALEKARLTVDKKFRLGS